MGSRRRAKDLAGWGILLAALLVAGPACRAADAGADEVSAASVKPASDVTLYVVGGVAHTEIAIPRTAFERGPPRLRAAVDRLGEGPWVVVGWGPWWFGHDPRWRDPRSYALRAADATWSLLTPQTTSRLRLAAIGAPGAGPGEHALSMIPVRVSADGLDRAVARIDQTLTAAPDGGPVVTWLPPDKPNVAVFLSGEHYNITHECNHWIADVLRAGGVGVPPGVALFPQTLALDLEVANATAARPQADPPAASAQASR